MEEVRNIQAYGIKQQEKKMEKVEPLANFLGQSISESISSNSTALVDK